MLGQHPALKEGAGDGISFVLDKQAVQSCGVEEEENALL